MRLEGGGLPRRRNMIAECLHSHENMTSRGRYKKDRYDIIEGKANTGEGKWLRQLKKSGSNGTL